MDNQDWSEADIRHRLHRNGGVCREDAVELLALFAEQLKPLEFPESPISEPLRDYVVEALQSYLCGDVKSLDHAFGLKGKGSGRRPSREIRERNERLAGEVAILMEEAGETLDVAAEHVAQRYGMDDTEVRKIYCADQQAAWLGLLEHKLDSHNS